MVTRKITDNNKEFGIELSRPGLRGQNGGPLFDQDGIIYQSYTNHLHLGFDTINKEEYIGTKKKKISHYPFLNQGFVLIMLKLKSG